MSISKKAALAAAATLSISGMGVSAYAAPAHSSANAGEPALSLSVDQHGRALVNHEAVTADQTRIAPDALNRRGWNLLCGRNGRCK